MPYPIKCNRCGHSSTAWEIVDFIANHTAPDGRLRCDSCSANDAHIYRHSKTQDGGTWERYIRAVIPFRTQFGRKFVPYVFLLSYSARGRPVDVHFNYYKDERPKGRLKHGHGPGGAPVFGKHQIVKLIENVIRYKVITRNDLEQAINGCGIAD